MSGKYKTAILIKHTTGDGLFEMQENIPIGTGYIVDITTKRIENGVNIFRGIEWRREIINIVDAGWMPTELLDIKE